MKKVKIYKLLTGTVQETKKIIMLRDYDDACVLHLNSVIIFPVSFHPPVRYKYHFRETLDIGDSL